MGEFWQRSKTSDRAQANLDRTASFDSLTGMWTPDPTKFSQKPNLEDRLVAEDKKKQKEKMPNFVTAGRGQAKVGPDGEIPYGIAK